MTTRTAPRPFTGWHMTGILVGFFAIVMAVNFAMARFALSSFGGTVVDNSYVASQHYNKWLGAAAAQQKLGWSATLARLPDDRVAVRFTGAPDGLTVTAVARHPLGHAPDQALTFARAADGTFVSTRAVAPGRWMVRISAEAGQARWREEQELR